MRSLKGFYIIIHNVEAENITKLRIRGVAQLVARLLWEQDAAGSSPVTPTIKREETLQSRGSSLFVCVQNFICILRSKQVPALGIEHDCRRWRIKGVRNGAAVKIVLAKRADNFGHRNVAAQPRMPPLRP